MSLGKRLRRSNELTGGEGIPRPTSLFVLAIFFLGGAVLGSLLGASEAAVSENVQLSGESIYGYSTYFGLLLSCSKYHLAVLLFSTSILGFAAIPAIMAVRGFVLSCTVASVALSYPGHGAALALIVLGLPSLFTVPALFILGGSGTAFSVRLLDLLRRRVPRRIYPREENGILFSLSLLIIAAAVEYWLVPAITRLMI